MRNVWVVGLALWVGACASLTMPPETAPPRFTRGQYADLPGWAQDDLADVSIALNRSCAKMMALPPDRAMKPAGHASDWASFCAMIQNPQIDMRQVIETELAPWRVTTDVRDDGLFTGYYEAALRGSRTAQGLYQTPIRARPLDHVVVDLGVFKPELDGQRVTGQLRGTPGINLTLTPYPARAEIAAGKIPPPADAVLAWVDDPVDAFFLEIQGSGQIALDDGSVMHVGYAERNGHPYTAIGKILVARGEMTPETASMQSIRAWLTAHPDQRQALLNENASAVFFREIGPEGPLGAQEVPLTPQRSLAVDKAFWSYGLPFFIDADNPQGDIKGPRLQRLMVAQDTGGAIKGAVRGDVFWGAGDIATETAGVMKSRGNYWVLLPKTISP